MHEMIPLIPARNLPDEVEMWCVRNEINTHYDNDVAYIPNDGNPFWQWLLEQGIADNSKEGMRIAIMA